MSAKEWDVVQQLMQKQPFGVLGTTREGHAYASLVAFAVTTDFSGLYFATTRATRKYHNLSKDKQVSLLVDNRSSQDLPLYETAAVSVYGVATELGAEEVGAARETYLAMHPQLRTFINAPNTAIFRVDVETYDLVLRFQRVTEFRLKK